MAIALNTTIAPVVCPPLSAASRSRATIGAPSAPAASRYRRTSCTTCRSGASSPRTTDLGKICSAIGVRERKLRACCQEELGMSPFQHLWLRRMCLAREALQTADPSIRTVTEIATEYGFGELGRSVSIRRIALRDAEALNAAVNRRCAVLRPLAKFFQSV